MPKNEATSIEISEVSSKEMKGKAPLLLNSSSSTPSAREVGHVDNAGYKRGVSIFDLMIRISAATASLAATIAMGTTEQTLPFFTQFFQFKASYDDLPTFSFFVIAMAIVTSYLVLSIPFSIVCIARPVATGPRILLIILDTLALTLATSAAGASAAIVYLAHNGNSDANWLAICQQFTDFCQRTSGSVVAGFIAVLLLVFLLVISAIALKRH